MHTFAPLTTHALPRRCAHTATRMTQNARQHGAMGAVGAGAGPDRWRVGRGGMHLIARAFHYIPASLPPAPPVCCVGTVKPVWGAMGLAELQTAMPQGVHLHACGEAWSDACWPHQLCPAALRPCPAGSTRMRRKLATSARAGRSAAKTALSMPTSACVQTNLDCTSHPAHCNIHNDSQGWQSACACWGLVLAAF